MYVRFDFWPCGDSPRQVGRIEHELNLERQRLKEKETELHQLRAMVRQVQVGPRSKPTLRSSAHALSACRPCCMLTLSKPFLPPADGHGDQLVCG